MNQLDVRILQTIRANPALSILLPTHRTSPENRQDPIRLKNLVNEASERLKAEYPMQELRPLFAQLDNVLESIDLNYALDGLAIFVNRDFGRKFDLPFSVKPRVVVDETFATRDLVYAMNRSPRYWVLALSEQDTRLLEGTRDSLIEVKEHGFPMRHSGPGGDAPLPNAPEINVSALRDERHRQFFRQVDQAFGAVAKQDDLPLVLVGVDRYLAFFREVSQHGSKILTTLAGNHDKTTPHDLGKLLWEPVQAALKEERRAKMDALEAAVGARKFVSGVGEVWRYAHDGRGEQLLVEEHFYFPATVDESGRHIQPAEDASAPGVIDDAVDEIIEAVLKQGGKVSFVEDGTLDQHQRISLILRY